LLVPARPAPLLASPAGLPLFCQYHLQRVQVQRLLRHDPLQPTVLFLQLTQPPGLAHFQASILRLPVVERGCTDTDPAAEVLHGNSGIRLLQHPHDLLFTKTASFHGASPLLVLYPEKLRSGWTKFRGAGHLFGISSRPPREFSLTSAGTKKPG